MSAVTIDTSAHPAALVGGASPTLSIVVPIYNEEDSIPHLYDRLTTVLEGYGHAYEIIAVDDGSRDGSFALLSDLAASDPRLRVVRFRRNFGQTPAFAAGFDRAQGEYIVTIDADLQNDPNDIPMLMARASEGYDVVSGWRARRQDAFINRKLPSMIANRLISWVTGVHLHDYGCSLKVYRADVVKNINLYGELHRFIPAVASWQGVAVTEMAVHHEARRYGTSKYGIGRTVRVLLDLITVRFLLSYSTRPMQIFGLWGLLSMLSGFVISVYLVAIKLLYNAEIGSRPLLLLGVLLIILGVQFIGIGLMGELLMRTYYETQKKPIYVVREELNTNP
ncbi:glycosyltransferase family 2 protein [Chloroflexales bacterium ZM16-3]|nr:glycosyltransferase family 2 protein [Chloroflexales bacterium ZM16-3]